MRGTQRHEQGNNRGGGGGENSRKVSVSSLLTRIKLFEKNAYYIKNLLQKQNKLITYYKKKKLITLLVILFQNIAKGCLASLN